MKRQRFNNLGLSLMELVVSIAITGIGFIALMSMNSNQQNELKMVTQKMATNDIKIALQHALSSEDFCGCLFRGKTFDTTKSNEPWSSPITTIPLSWGFPIPNPPTACTGSGIIVPAVGQKLSDASNLEIKSISTNDIADQGHGLYTANLTIDFNAARALPPVRVPFLIAVDPNAGSPSARNFLACGTVNTDDAEEQKSGAQMVTACGNNVCCTDVVFSTPFSSNQYAITITPYFQDYGSMSADITSGYQAKTTNGFKACFDHIGKSIGNSFEFNWTATAYTDFPTAGGGGGGGGGGRGGGRGGGGCFVAGTQISMADGSVKNIEDVQIGEMVKTYDEDQHLETISPVIKTFHHEYRLEKIYTITLSNFRKIISNDIHAFYLQNMNQYMQAKDFSLLFHRGQEITFLDENSEVVSIQNIDINFELTRVYNLHVQSPYDTAEGEGFLGHNYYANGILVHNMNGTQVINTLTYLMTNKAYALLGRSTTRKH